MEREAREFPTEKALKKYLEEHPEADPKAHTVAEKEKPKGKPEEEKKKGPADTEKIPVESPKGGEKMLEKRKGKPPATPKDLPEEHREAIEEYNLEIVGDDAHQAAEIARKVKEGIEAGADVCKMSPPVCVGNKGLTRDKMPQIEGGKSVREMLDSDDELERKKGQAMVQAGADPDDDRPIMRQMLDRFKEAGAGSKQSRIRVGELKATQKEIKAAKTFGIADAHLKGKFNALTEEPKVMISRDGYILDGHHRWAAVLTIDPKRTMEVVVIDMDMDDLLHEAASMPGVYQADFQGEPLSEKDQKEYKRKHKSKLKEGSLRKALIRLAYEHPEARAKILPLLIEATRREKPKVVSVFRKTKVDFRVSVLVGKTEYIIQATIVDGKEKTSTVRVMTPRGEGRRAHGRQADAARWAAGEALREHQDLAIGAAWRAKAHA